MYTIFFKRLTDIILATLFTILLIPVFVIVTILIKLDSKGSIFFFQDRLGKNGKVFKIFKFRTMTDRQRINDSEVFKSNSEVTKIGYYLRRFKIDEMPQLLNVVFGDLSIIGPRPLLLSSSELLDDTTKMRLTVRPGLSGLAQINGNIYISREERFKFDLEYVNNISFWLDFTILLKTILVVIFGEDKFINKNAKNG